MKKIIIIAYLVVMVFMANAQSWNPYVNQGMMSPDPVLPTEFEGTGVISFNLGNTGSSMLMYDGTNSDNNLKVVISLSNGILDSKNPAEAISGSWKNLFSWSYDATANTIIGMQSSNISGDSQGTLTVDYEVLNNTSVSVVGNGFGVELQTPSYMAATNHSQDDLVSSYTFTQAYDGGDAPESYGTAIHEINFAKDAYTGNYSKYIYLGEKVDYEINALSSWNASGDDNDSFDDEDGVTFPEMFVGTTVKIPVVVTAQGDSYGILNAWFDWNGDGDFEDAGEKVLQTPLVVRSSNTYELSVEIPETAITGESTYARFRVGANSDATSFNAWGEAEDYEISLKSASVVTDVPQLTLDENSLFNVKLYPNPIANQYTISINQDGDYLLELKDILGRTISTSEMKVEGNYGEKTLYRNNVISGQYFMRITDKLNQKAQTLKIIMSEL